VSVAPKRKKSAAGQEDYGKLYVEKCTLTSPGKVAFKELLLQKWAEDSDDNRALLEGPLAEAIREGFVKVGSNHAARAQKNARQERRSATP